VSSRKLRLSASGAIYVAMAEVNTAPRQDGRAVAIYAREVDGIICFRGRHCFHGYPDSADCQLTLLVSCRIDVIVAQINQVKR